MRFETDQHLAVQVLLPLFKVAVASGNFCIPHRVNKLRNLCQRNALQLQLCITEHASRVGVARQSQGQAWCSLRCLLALQHWQGSLVQGQGQQVQGRGLHAVGGQQGLNQRQQSQPDLDVFWSDRRTGQQVLDCRHPTACGHSFGHLHPVTG